MLGILGTVAAAVVLVMAVAAGSAAEEFCITSLDELDAALEKAASNGEDDVLRVHWGLDVDGVRYAPEIGHGLTIDTGYNDGCAEKIIKPFQPMTLMSAPGGVAGTTPEPQHSTTGPVPPAEVAPKATFNSLGALSAAGGTEKVLGVPGYLWRHGCGPTAAGMLLGYYDVNGTCPNLFEGSAATQTTAVDQGIASQTGGTPGGHYEDYSLPDDSSSSSVIPDKSDLGGAHTSDSIADFMHTSWSRDGNFYGWSYSDKIAPAITSYTALKDSACGVTTTEYYYYYSYSPMLTWSVLTTEIDAGRPMIFLVDTNADGYTDHFVTVVGYRDSPSQQYACLDTWPEADSVRWENFAVMASGTPWGIWGALGVQMTAPPSSPTGVNPGISLLLLN